MRDEVRIMGLWQVLSWAIVAGVVLILFVGLALTLGFRIYYTERRRHLAELVQMIQTAAREAKRAREVNKVHNGSV
jgi:hypothetical protein